MNKGLQLELHHAAAVADAIALTVRGRQRLHPMRTIKGNESRDRNIQFEFLNQNDYQFI